MSEVETPVEGAAPLPETPAQPEQQESQASAPANPDEPKDDQPRDDKGRFQKRVNELTRQRYEAQRETAQLRSELDQLRQQFTRATQPPPPDPSQDFPGYVRHLASEEARQMVEAQQGQWQQHQVQQHRQALAQQYQTREQAYATEHPGYEEAADAFLSIAGDGAPELAEVLMSSDHGPAVVEYLGTHLDEAVSILRMPAHLAAAAVARIEARVSAPKPKPATKAPAPVPTLSGSAAVSKDPAKMSYEEYKKYRQGS